MAMPYELLNFPTAGELAAKAAEDWLRELAGRRTADAPPYLVALSGGRITKTFFAETVRLVEQQHSEANGGIFTDQKVHFFWADERCVPPTDAESNYRMARELLFEPLKIPEPQIHRLRGEAREDDALRGATEELCRLAPGGAKGQPIFDLIFLGMGEDGHVASLFPGEPEAVMNDTAIYRAVTAVKPPPRRITLGYGTIAAAKECWVLASGAGKEAALQESLSPAGRTPLGRVLGLRRQTRIYTDVKAGVKK